ncbi:Transposable element Tc1 transposase, partial [Stegodyphus mimosarum]
MASKYHLEESVKWRIIGRLEAGQSIMETATCLNISRQTVSKLWKQFQNDGSVVRRPGQGRKRMTTASEDRYLALTARRNRKATARQLSSELAAATGTVASRQTIYRRLNEKGLYARKPRVCVLLSSQKKKDRFNWCKEHQNWTEHQWSHVLFTDESRFSLTGDSKRVYIWRESGTRNDPSNIVERDRFGSGGVMVWGRWTGAYGPNFLFMDDNARPHRANLVDEFLESEDIKRIPWPPNSPDLNPIENLWDYLGRAIARIHPPPRDDGAPPHIARRVKDLLRASFGDDRVLSRHFRHAWPPRSPDLSPCDYWLWGYLKSQVYCDRPTSQGMLKDNIRRQCLTITPDMLCSAVRNINPRLQLLLRNDVEHIEHFL